jgi:hypothetical protein
MFQVRATGIEEEEETALVLHTIMTQMLFFFVNYCVPR